MTIPTPSWCDRPLTGSQCLPAPFRGLILLATLLGILAGPVPARTLIASGPYGAVSTGHPEATQAALRLLERGGNAVDAAVAAAFVLAVVDPSTSGLGGDGFALVRQPDGAIETWDASAPPPRRRHGGTSEIGLPTEPALLLHLHRRAGVRGLPEVMAPAIRLARRGFPVSPSLERLLEKNLGRFPDPLARRRFGPEGRPARAGERLVHPELAEVLSVMAIDGGASFYRGAHAALLAEDLRARGSDHGLEDLAAFLPRPAEPVRLAVGAWELVGPPPPSSAIVVMGLVKALVREGLPDFTTPARTRRTLDLLVRALQIKYHHLAACLTSPRRFLALLEHARIQPEPGLPSEAASGLDETTHLVTWDRQGRIVSMTLTLGRHFGTLAFSPLGFFYNDEMRNFTPIVARYPTDYPPQAGPISAKAPLLLLREGRPVVAIGGAGANRIITNLAVILAWFIQGGFSLPELVHGPRLAPKEPGGPVVEWAPPNPGRPLAPSPAVASLTVHPPGGDLFGLVAAVASLDSHLLAVGDYRRSGAAAALRRDPETPRTWQLEVFTWHRKGLDEVAIADVVPSHRQTTTGWRHIGEPLPEEPPGPTPRRRLVMPSTASAIMLRQNVRIDPAAPAGAPPPWDDPARWSGPEPLGPREREFLARVPPDLEGRALVDWLAVTIGHAIPYQRLPGRMSGEDLLRLGHGDCSGKARLFLGMARARGIPCRLVGGLILRPGLQDTTHIWNEVWLDGRWETVCTTNHVRGRIPPTWLIMRYGDTGTLETPGRLLFRIHEIDSRSRQARALQPPRPSRRLSGTRTTTSPEPDLQEATP